ncbi:MAG: ABC transporter permease [Acidobacteria bacterium]|nr:ABC transporter permease [Acidobacteriota bacterium]
MANLAWKNLVYDKVRLSVTLTGIVFALVLVLIQFGLFLGFLDTTANIVAASGADLWITAPGIPHVNGATAIPESRRYKALSVAGVERAEKHNIQFVNWKLPSGAQEAVQIVGFELNSGMGGPWNIVEGSVDDLRGEDTVMVDELYKEKLGVKGIGHVAEIQGKRARVVGFTRAIRSFTTSPYVFTSFKNSQNYARLGPDEMLFLLVKLAPGANAAAVQKALQETIPGVDVYTNAEMRRKTQNYWLFSTGAGVTTLMGAALGLLVGMVVVAQTIYASTVDHIREFGTLKAMGAGNGYVYKVIIQQALISAGFGYVLAIGAGYLVAKGSETGNAAILLPPEMALGTLVLAALMCIGASVISIRKATTIDPALVFKG